MTTNPSPPIHKAKKIDWKSLLSTISRKSIGKVKSETGTRKLLYQRNRKVLRIRQTQKQIEIIGYWQSGLSNGAEIARMVGCNQGYVNRIIGLLVTNRIRLKKVGAKKELKCLRCGEMFVSSNKGYRLCVRCRNTIKKIERGIQ